MVKLSDLARDADKLMEGGERIFFIKEAFNWVTDLLGAVRGKPPRENAPAAVKALSGAFGKGDEILMQHMLRDFRHSYIDESDDKDAGVRAGEEAVKILTDFITWHYHGQQFQTSTGKVITWWYLNSWRVFITKMTTTPEKIGTKKVVSKTRTDPEPPDPDVLPWVLYGPRGEVLRRGPKPNLTTKGHETEVSTESDVYSGNDQGVEFLRYLVKMIKSYDNRVKGFKAVLTFFKAWGIPVMPEKNMILWFVEWTVNYLKTNLPALYQNTVEGARLAVKKNADRIREKRAKQGIVPKLLRKILPFT